MSLETHGGNVTRITTATDTNVKDGPGVLHYIIIGTTTAGAITIYDNTAASGTIIAKLKASMPEGSYAFFAKFSTGLTITTAGASDITVIHS